MKHVICAGDGVLLWWSLSSWPGGFILPDIDYAVSIGSGRGTNDDMDVFAVMSLSIYVNTLSGFDLECSPQSFVQVLAPRGSEHQVRSPCFPQTHTLRHGHSHPPRFSLPR